VTVKQNGSAVRVLVIEGHGLVEAEAAADGIFEGAPPKEVVRAGSVSQARELLRAGEFDLVVADETRFRGVLDAIFAFVGLFSLDGTVLDANRAPLVAGGLERADVVGRRFVDLPWFSHSEIERARIGDALARAARGESVRLETNVLSHRGGILSIDAAFAPLRGRDGTVTHVVGTGVDVTVRRNAERALARSEARLAEAQRVAHVGSWEWEVADNQVTWSDELYRIYGVDPCTFVPTYQGFLAAVHPEDRPHTEAVLHQAMENVSPFTYDHRILRPDGSIRMLHTRGEVLGGPERRAMRLVGSCWDITDRWEALRHAEAARGDAEAARGALEKTLGQLRALGARLSEIREDERRDIARELHDQVGQSLTALKLEVGGLRAQLDGGGGTDETRARLTGMEALLDATLDCTRRISTVLRPAILDDLGLPAAIRWQAREFSQRTGIASDTQLPDDGSAVAPPTALALFRILQEALTNVTRHARARQVHIGLRLDDGFAVLTVADDGVGIAPDALSRPTSLGLLGMRERALALAGEVAVTGEAGKGTTVTVRVPAASREKP
jgi:PAS domain S-box-containing protein